MTQFNRSNRTKNKLLFSGSDRNIIKYFSWDEESGTNIPGHCMYLSGDKVKWKTALCHSTTEVSYFVCEKGTSFVMFIS